MSESNEGVGEGDFGDIEPQHQVEGQEQGDAVDHSQSVDESGHTRESSELDEHGEQPEEEVDQSNKPAYDVTQSALFKRMAERHAKSDDEEPQREGEEDSEHYHHQTSSEEQHTQETESEYSEDPHHPSVEPEELEVGEREVCEVASRITESFGLDANREALDEPIVVSDERPMQPDETPATIDKPVEVVQSRQDADSSYSQQTVTSERVLTSKFESMTIPTDTDNSSSRMISEQQPPASEYQTRDYGFPRPFASIADPYQAQQPPGYSTSQFAEQQPQPYYAPAPSTNVAPGRRPMAIHRKVSFTERKQTPIEPLNLSTNVSVASEPVSVFANTGGVSSGGVPYVGSQIIAQDNGPSLNVQMRRPNSERQWGFNFYGGSEYGCPPFVNKVNPKSLAGMQGLEVGDVLVSICQSLTVGKNNSQLKAELLRAGNELDLVVIKRGIDLAKVGQYAPQAMTVSSPKSPTGAGSSMKFFSNIESASRVTGPSGAGVPSYTEGLYRPVKTKSLRMLEQQLASGQLVRHDSVHESSAPRLRSAPQRQGVRQVHTSYSPQTVVIEPTWQPSASYTPPPSSSHVIRPQSSSSSYYSPNQYNQPDRVYSGDDHNVYRVQTRPLSQQMHYNVPTSTYQGGYNQPSGYGGGRQADYYSGGDYSTGGHSSIVCRPAGMSQSPDRFAIHSSPANTYSTQYVSPGQSSYSNYPQHYQQTAYQPAYQMSSRPRAPTSTIRSSSYQYIQPPVGQPQAYHYQY